MLRIQILDAKHCLCSQCGTAFLVQFCGPSFSKALWGIMLKSVTESRRQHGGSPMQVSPPVSFQPASCPNTHSTTKALCMLVQHILRRSSGLFTCILLHVRCWCCTIGWPGGELYRAMVYAMQVARACTSQCSEADISQGFEICGVAAPTGWYRAHC